MVRKKFRPPVTTALSLEGVVANAATSAMDENDPSAGRYRLIAAFL